MSPVSTTTPPHPLKVQAFDAQVTLKCYRKSYWLTGKNWPGTGLSLSYLITVTTRNFHVFNILLNFVLSQIFAGNTDRNTVISHSLKPHIDARYIRFHPITYNLNAACLRAELYGCRNGKSSVVVYLRLLEYVLLSVSGLELWSAVLELLTKLKKKKLTKDKKNSLFNFLSPTPFTNWNIAANLYGQKQTFSWDRGLVS